MINRKIGLFPIPYTTLFCSVQSISTETQMYRILIRNLVLPPIKFCEYRIPYKKLKMWVPYFVHTKCTKPKVYTESRKIDISFVFYLPNFICIEFPFL